jgi:hypothetical protein
MSMFQGKPMGGKTVSRTVSSPLVIAGVVFSLVLGGFALSPGHAATRSSEAEKMNTDHYITPIRGFQAAVSR